MPSDAHMLSGKEHCSEALRNPNRWTKEVVSSKRGV